MQIFLHKNPQFAGGIFNFWTVAKRSRNTESQYPLTFHLHKNLLLQDHKTSPGLKTRQKQCDIERKYLGKLPKYDLNLQSSYLFYLLIV